MSLRFIAAVASLGLALSATGTQAVDGFAARSFNGANGVTMRYRLFVPSAEARKKALPLSEDGRVLKVCSDGSQYRPDACRPFFEMLAGRRVSPDARR